MQLKIFDFIHLFVVKVNFFIVKVYWCVHFLYFKYLKIFIDSFLFLTMMIQVSFLMYSSSFRVRIFVLVWLSIEPLAYTPFSSCFFNYLFLFLIIFLIWSYFISFHLSWTCTTSLLFQVKFMLLLFFKYLIWFQFLIFKFTILFISKWIKLHSF